LLSTSSQKLAGINTKNEKKVGDVTPSKIVSPKEFGLLAAPLEDYSDRAFRSICFQYGATKTYTEMARLEGLSRNNKSTWNRLLIDNTVPTVVQLLPTNLEELNKFLEMWEERGLKTMEWNLNLGCPSHRVINLGLGCAMMKRITKINQFMEILKTKTKTPVSIKMRLGMNATEAGHKVYLNLLKETDAEYYIIHARHGKQSSSSKPDYSVFPECVATGKKIYANGDIRSVEDMESMRKMGLHGVMLGRVAVQNPMVFKQYKDFVESGKLPSQKGQELPELREQAITEVKTSYEAIYQKYYAGDEELGDKYRRAFLRHFASPHFKDLVFTSG